MRYRQFISRFGLYALMLGGLNACTYLIPADPSAPRFNSAIGDRHAPIANSQPPGPQDMVEHVYTEGMNDTTEYEVPQMVGPAAPAPMPAPVAMAAPVAPAVAPSPQGAMISSATAPTVIPIAPAMMPQPVAPMAMGAPAPMPMPAPAMQTTAPLPPGLPPVDLLTQSQAQRELAAASRRQTPYENYGNPSMNMARSDLNAVPPRPQMWGPNSAQSQLGDTRNALEQDLQNTDAAREQLKRDAASEPSLLPGRAPAPVPMPQNGVPQSSVMPMGLIPPPPPLMAPGTVPMASQGINAPILLRPPNSRPVAAITPMQSQPDAPVQAPAASYYGAARDGFDPMATAAAMGASTAPNAYTGEGFMPQPRYKR